MELNTLKLTLSNHLLGNDYVLLFVSFLFAGMSLCAFMKPIWITEQFDIHSLTDSGKNEVRAVYGGFGFFMSFALILALQIPEIRNGICITTSLALGGMAFGRIVSAVIDRSIAKLPIFYGLMEMIISISLLLYN